MCNGASALITLYALQLQVLCPLLPATSNTVLDPFLVSCPSPPCCVWHLDWAGRLLTSDPLAQDTSLPLALPSLSSYAVLWQTQNMYLRDAARSLLNAATGKDCGLSYPFSRSTQTRYIPPPHCLGWRILSFASYHTSNS